MNETMPIINAVISKITLLVSASASAMTHQLWHEVTAGFAPISN